jgi:ribosome maturation factor RimP
MAQRGRGAAAGARPAALAGMRNDPSSGARGDPSSGTRRDPSSGARRDPGSGARRTAGDPGAPNLAAQRARLQAVIEPVVTAAGLDLEQIAVSRAGPGHVVRITVDGEDLGLEVLAEISHDISVALDAADKARGGRSPMLASGTDQHVTAYPYTLEVSSPGVDRPLTLPRHWLRNIGRLVKVNAGQRTVTARVAGADKAGVTLEVGDFTSTFTFDQLGPGRVQVEFTRLEGPDDEGFGDGLRGGWPEDESAQERAFGDGDEAGPPKEVGDVA